MGSIKRMHVLHALMLSLLLLHGWVLLTERSWSRYWSRVERVMVP